MMLNGLQRDIQATKADLIASSLRGQCELISQLVDVIESDVLTRQALSRRITEIETNLRKLRAAV